MFRNTVSWVRKQPLIAFYILAFTISWLGWIPQAAYSHGYFPFDNFLFYVLGGVGPMLAAYIVLRILHRNDAIKLLFNSLMKWKVGIIWYIIAIFGNVVIWFAVISISGSMSSHLSNVRMSLTMLPIFVQYIFAAVGEQVAWSGFALPRLQARYNALVSSLIVGFLWALWHMPLLFMKNNVMSTYPIIPFFIEITATYVFYTWLLNNTRGSVLIVSIFHAATNIFGLITGFVNTNGESIVAVFIAVIIIIFFGPSCFTHNNDRFSIDVSGENKRISL